MTKQSIVVCDSDEAYVRAFAAYLMECLSDVTIVSFTSEEAFLASEAVYSIGILSKDFLSVLEFSGKEMVHEKFYLCDEIIESACNRKRQAVGDTAPERKRHSLSGSIHQSHTNCNYRLLCP